MIRTPGEAGSSQNIRGRQSWSPLLSGWGGRSRDLGTPSQTSPTSTALNTSSAATYFSSPNHMLRTGETRHAHYMQSPLMQNMCTHSVFQRESPPLVGDSRPRMLSALIVEHLPSQRAPYSGEASPAIL